MSVDDIERAGDLGTFEGEDVNAIRLILTKTGYGFQQSVKVAPTKLHRHQVVDLVVRAVVAEVRHPDTLEKDTEGVDRVQVLECMAITIVDDVAVRKLIDKHLATLAKAKAEADKAKELAGQRTIHDELDDQPDTDDPEIED